MTVITEGNPTAPAFVFLHGWPETPHCWREVMHLAAADGNFAVAVDLLDLCRRATPSHHPVPSTTTPPSAVPATTTPPSVLPNTTTPPSAVPATTTPPSAVPGTTTSPSARTTDAGNSTTATDTTTATGSTTAGSTTATESTKATKSTGGTDSTGATDSTGGTDLAGGTKAALAAAVREALQPLGLTDITLVGHDCGGMVTFAYLRAYGRELRRAVIMDTVVPGVEPWEQVRRNPYIWHFGLHAVPGLPELLVRGHERAYFDYFYDVLSPEPSAVPDEARAVYAAAYAAPGALEAGFSWYRAFPADAAANAEAVDVRTPLLYLRGELEGGDIAAYAAGFRAAGVRDVTTGVIKGAGHFAPDQAPAEVWGLIAGS